MVPQRTRFLVALFATALVAVGVMFSRLTAEEPKLTTLTGVVLSERTDQPIGRANVTLRGEWIRFWDTVETDDRGRFRFLEIPVGNYLVEANGRAHKQRQPIRYHASDGGAERIALRLPSVAPYLRARIRHRSMMPGEPITIGCEGLVAGENLDSRLYRVTSQSLVRQVLNPPHNYYEDELSPALERIKAAMESPTANRLPAGVALVKEWDEPIRKRDSEGLMQQKLALGKLEEGAYILTVAADRPPTADQTKEGPLLTSVSFSVTRLGLITKYTLSKMLVYALDLQKNEPWEGVQVGGMVTGRKATDERGLALVELARSQTDRKFVMASAGDSVAAVSPYIYHDEAEVEQNVYFYTERPVYRPGHTVHFKGIVRLLQGGKLVVPSPRNVQVEVRSPQGLLLGNQTLRTNRFGTFNGRCVLPTEADLGHYNVVVRTGGGESFHGFYVAEYRKPEYEVTVNTDRPRYLKGDTIRVRASARYYFGSPVANAEVHWYAFAEPQWYHDC